MITPAETPVTITATCTSAGTIGIAATHWTSAQSSELVARRCGCSTCGGVGRSTRNSLKGSDET